MDIYSKIVATMYAKNKIFFMKTAKFVLSNFYYVPLENEDLISNCLHELIIIAKTLNNKSTKNTKLSKKNEKTVEIHLFSKVKYIMYSYCRSYSNHNNSILNNYIEYDLVDNLQGSTYDSSNLNIDYLSFFHKDLINDLFVFKIPIKKVAIKHHTTSTAINKEIKKIKIIIQTKLDNTTF